MTLEELSQIIRQINRENGWNVLEVAEWENPYKIPTILALIHSEVSEALEAFRHNDKENFREECADMIIRILDMTGGIPDMNIDEELKKKCEKNKSRGYRHGNKRV